MRAVILALTPHPDFPCAVLARLDVEVERAAPSLLRLRYRLHGITTDLVFPPEDSGRTDELWRHTCLEAFARLPGPTGYRELNLSPGGPWAAYRFDGYREGMADADMAAPAAALGRPGDDPREFKVDWTLDLPADAPWQVAVTAVIEAADGTVSYWSLRHPEGRPDFHHADGFVLDLPPPSSA
jgi:hypothetical protein